MKKLFGAAKKAHEKKVGKKGRSHNMSKKSATHRKKSFTIPIGVVAGIMPGISKVYSARSAGLNGMVYTGTAIYTGYHTTDGSWGFRDMKQGLMPLVLGLGIHKLAQVAGINRMLAQSGIPLLRV